MNRTDSADGRRRFWVDRLQRMAMPVLRAAARGSLRKNMPVEGPAAASRRPFAVLEAVGRTIAGIAPWLDAEGLVGEEASRQREAAELTRRAVAAIVDPTAPDFAQFTPAHGGQPLVDAAFLAHGLLRAPRTLWDRQPPTTRGRILDALRQTRTITAHDNNWLLFAAIIEAALLRFDGDCDWPRVDLALERHATWYMGDGLYGDGPRYRFDYYNSFVIHPMMLDVLDLIAPRRGQWAVLHEQHRQRAGRYAVILERLIAADGSFPPVGRSLCYRCGAFHHLAATALRRQLPEALQPAQVRCALAAVIGRTLDAPGTFTDAGFLRPGLAGHQPGLAESYITTGSCYLAALAFLPLGLPPHDAFWTDADAPWTARQVWSGADVQADHALD